MVPFESLGAVSYSPSNYGAILYRLQDRATYWSKIAKFLHSTLFSAPTGVTRGNFAKVFDTHKARMIGLPCGEETMTIC